MLFGLSSVGNKIKRGRTGTNDAEHSARPNSAAVPENTKKLQKLVLADRKLKLRVIAEEMISEECIYHFA